MNYTEEKTRIENEIKRLQSELETLEKQKNREKYAEKLKIALKAEFEKFLDTVDFIDLETEYLQFVNRTSFSELCKMIETVETFGTKPDPVKVETEPTAEPKTEEKTEPTKEPERPENKIVICSVPKPNETPEEKPVKMKMTLDEFIDSLPEPAQK